MDRELCALLEKMTTELGNKVGYYYQAEFTVRDVVERRGKIVTEIEKNYVAYTIRRFYPESKIDPPNGNDGGKVHMKIWSK